MPTCIKCWKVLNFTALVFAACSFAVAAERSPRCVSIVEDHARLACYDDLFGRQHESEPTDAAAPIAIVSKREALQDFGLTREQIRQRDADHTGDDTLSEISAAVRRIERLKSGSRLLILDNGQHWLLTENTSRGRIEAGDTVRVRRAALGSFMVVTPDRISLRARRVR